MSASKCLNAKGICPINPCLVISHSWRLSGNLLIDSGMLVRIRSLFWSLQNVTLSKVVSCEAVPVSESSSNPALNTSTFVHLDLAFLKRLRTAKYLTIYVRLFESSSGGLYRRHYMIVAPFEKLRN